MTDRQKPKSSNQKNTNPDRKNGKAFKKGNRGSRPVRLAEVEKVLLGQGDAVSFPGVGWEPSTQWPTKAKKERT